MVTEKWKDRRVQGAIGILIIIIILLLLKSCTPTTDILTIEEYELKTEELIKEEEKNHDEWNDLLDTTQFEDLCTSVYQKQFIDLGNRFISIQKEFSNLKVEENQETKIPKYQWMVSYFDSYQKIGEQLLVLSGQVKEGNYENAVDTLIELQELNKAIPKIE